MAETNTHRQYTIADVERDTGLGKDTLRVWERRYGFPRPQRDVHGERLYDQATLDRLRQICRLMLRGHRPGRLVVLDETGLAELESSSRRPVSRPAAAPADSHGASVGASVGGSVGAAIGAAIGASTGTATDASVGASIHASLGTHIPADDPAMTALLAQDANALRSVLSQGLKTQGLRTFVQHRVAPLVQDVGQAWLDGRIGVHQEHLFTEVVQSLLRQALFGLPVLPAEARPRVLLATLPGEPHGLGLLMAEVMLRLEGCACISLGVQTPVDALAVAARTMPADIVALSASSVMPERRLLDQVRELRELLPAQTHLWLGGEGARRRRSAMAAQVVAELAAIAPAVQAWREGLSTPQT